MKVATPIKVREAPTGHHVANGSTKAKFFEPGEAGMELRAVVDAWYLHRYHTRGGALNDRGANG